MAEQTVFAVARELYDLLLPVPEDMRRKAILMSLVALDSDGLLVDPKNISFIQTNPPEDKDYN